MKCELLMLYVLCCVGIAFSADPASSSTTAVTPSTTTPTVEKECASLNDSCETCVKHAKCLWCNGKGCIPYPVGEVIPSKETCPLDNARWGVCWVNYKILLIVMGVVAGVLLISFSCCIYCCCCRRKGDRRSEQREEARYEAERQERQTRHSERRQERAGRVDEIRRKYGLVKDSSDYQRFDNEA